MKILGIDTSTSTTCVAIVEDQQVLAEVALTGRISHSERVVEICREIFRVFDFSPRDMDLIAVGNGPGSFTGLRIGVTIGKVLAQALEVPIIGVSSLQAFALKERGVVASVMDARRGKVYCSLVDRRQGFQILLKDQVLPLEDFVKEVALYEEITLTGPDRDQFIDAFPQGTKPAFLPQMRASDICQLGRMNYEKDGADDLYQLVPNYLKISQAQRQYNEKHKTS